MSKRYTSYEQYKADLPKEKQEKLDTIRNFILETAPDSEELINYNIPAFALVKGGKRDQQIMIACLKDHIGFYPHPTTIEFFKDQLKDYNFSRGAIQFPLGKPLPEKLIKEMVEYRLKLLRK